MNRSDINILIVEDDYTHYFLIAEYLAPMGFNLIRTTDDVETWSVLIKQNIHLILMDVKLKKCSKSGIELSRDIKAFFPLIPILIQTAFIESIKEKDLIVVYDDYIIKPYGMELFTNKVLSILKLNIEGETGARQQCYSPKS